MHAHDRFLPEWFSRIRSRQITLPRFQRFEAWGHNEVSGLLTTVLRGLPSGAILVLEVGDKEKFRSRTMINAPETGEKVTEQLLDGQQRLTALWRSLNDYYPERTYLIGFEDEVEGGNGRVPFVYGQARWEGNGKTYPMWVDAPRECWSRGYIPIRLLRPEDILPEIRAWIGEAVGEDYESRDRLFDEIITLRDRTKEFNLPYLTLPPTTPKEVALDVFIKLNTSSMRLSTYDIVVALVEDETGRSLHEHVEELTAAVPRAAEYADLPGLVLDVVALRQNRRPSQAGYKGIDYGRMLDEWNQLMASVKGAVGFLEDESVFDEQRLPSYTAFPVITALWGHLPTNPDGLGNARILLRKYLWRAFLTSRYEQSSTNNALQDYRALVKSLNGEDEAAVPIFDEDEYPLPTSESLLNAEWPKRRTILGRGVLALQLMAGAEDLADGARANVSTITTKEHPREYHHLFPASLLEGAGLSEDAASRALNCALITWRTNRTISNKDPIEYLKERAQRSDLGEEELRRRLSTHLIPFKELTVGYQGLSDAVRNSRIAGDYQTFLQARAEIIAKAAQVVCEGRVLDPNRLL